MRSHIQVWFTSECHMFARLRSMPSSGMQEPTTVAARANRLGSLLPGSLGVGLRAAMQPGKVTLPSGEIPPSVGRANGAVTPSAPAEPIVLDSSTEELSPALAASSAGPRCDESPLGAASGLLHANSVQHESQLKDKILTLHNLARYPIAQLD